MNRRDPHFAIVLTDAEQSAACARCVLTDCNIRSPRCVMRRENSEAKRERLISKWTRYKRAKLKGLGEKKGVR